MYGAGSAGDGGFAGGEGLKTLSTFEEFCQILPRCYALVMATMNISLPDGLKSFVDERVASEGYGTSSEYVRELIRRDKDRRQFKDYLLAGLRSGAAGPMDNAYFEQLRNSLKTSSKLLT